MTVYAALLLLIPISLVISTALVALTTGPLRKALEGAAQWDGTLAFWVPYAIIMIYLVPLFVGLLFGVGTMPNSGVEIAAGYLRLLASVLGGCLLVLLGIGKKLSEHNQRVMHRRQLQAATRSVRT